MSPAATTDGPTTFHTNSVRQLVACRVCGRTLLLGERSVGFFTLSGEGPFDVCQLCVSRARRFGLIPRPSTPDEIARSRRAGLGRRLVATIHDVMGGGRTSTPEPAPQGSASIAAADTTAQPPRLRTRRRRAASHALDPAALGAVPVGAAATPMAIAAFNQSPHARTLAGLCRTLGEPRASVAPRSGTDREVIVTVAWEIVWYQFRIMPDGIEQHSGHYLTQLHERWKQWNCSVAADGTVRLQDAPKPDTCQDEGRTAAEEASP